MGAYVARDNPAAATNLLRSIRARARHLVDHPLLGRPTPFAGVRELVVHRNYLLSYRVQGDAVQILQVWHAAQNRGSP